MFSELLHLVLKYVEVSTTDKQIEDTIKNTLSMEEKKICMFEDAMC